jgi:hypothetical protein
LQLGMLIETIWILSVAPISRPAGWLQVCHFVRTRPQHAKKCFGRHGSCADFHVIGLLQHASPLGPEGLEAQDEFLKGERIGVALGQGFGLAISSQHSAFSRYEYAVTSTNLRP